MKDAVREHVRKLFQEGAIDAFLGLEEVDGHVAPCLFADEDDLERLHLGDLNAPGDARYPLNRVLQHLAHAYPDKVFGVLVRGCDERGLIELFKWNQLDEKRIVRVGFCCPEQLAEACCCPSPFPENPVAGSKAQGVPAEQPLEPIAQLSDEERFRFWMHHFDRCIKCYGCRNICPMCFCKDCSLEEKELVEPGALPPDTPIFHLVRAVHMAGRCIDCGLCEEACPANIPLRTLYKKVAEILFTDTGFRTGADRDQKSPLNLLMINP